MSRAKEHKESLTQGHLKDERSTEDAVEVIVDRSCSPEPLSDWNLGILGDRTSLDRKPLSAVQAVERLFIAELHGAAIASVRAKLAPLPAYRS